MSVRYYLRSRGFTIVELLIVIVVIGILAAITIVAYNGIQVRAENAKTVSAVQAYRKALTSYAMDNGSYPTAGALCLGSQYPVFSEALAGCRSTGSVISNNPTTLNKLSMYMGDNLPMPSTKVLYTSTGATGYVGAYFYGMSYNYMQDGKKVATLVYTIESNTCPVGPVYTGAPTYSTTAVTRTTTISPTASTCHLLLPDPSDL